MHCTGTTGTGPAQEAGARGDRLGRAQQRQPPPPPPEPGGQQPSVTVSWPLTPALYTGSVRERPASHSRYRRAYHTIPYIPSRKKKHGPPC